MRTVEELINLVDKWAEEKEIHQKGNSFSQIMKTYEEVGELVTAIKNNNKEEKEDAIGDILVTLINYDWFKKNEKHKFLENYRDSLNNYKLIFDNTSEQQCILHSLIALKHTISYELIPEINPNEYQYSLNITELLMPLFKICEINSLNIINCLNAAYEVISKRTGYMNDNGQFIKTNL